MVGFRRALLARSTADNPRVRFNQITILRKTNFRTARFIFAAVALSRMELNLDCPGGCRRPRR